MRENKNMVRNEGFHSGRSRFQGSNPDSAVYYQHFGQVHLTFLSLLFSGIK
jgi:hypothetical protein